MRKTVTLCDSRDCPDTAPIDLTLYQHQPRAEMACAQSIRVFAASSGVRANSYSQHRPGSIVGPAGLPRPAFWQTRRPSLGACTTVHSWVQALTCRFLCGTSCIQYATLNIGFAPGNMRCCMLVCAKVQGGLKECVPAFAESYSFDV